MSSLATMLYNYIHNCVAIDEPAFKTQLCDEKYKNTPRTSTFQHGRLNIIFTNQKVLYDFDFLKNKLDRTGTLQVFDWNAITERHIHITSQLNYGNNIHLVLRNMKIYYSHGYTFSCDLAFYKSLEQFNSLRFVKRIMVPTEWPGDVFGIILANLQPYERAVLYDHNTYYDAAKNGNVEYLRKYRSVCSSFDIAVDFAFENNQIGAVIFLLQYIKDVVAIFDLACERECLDVIKILADKVELIDLTCNRYTARKNPQLADVVALLTELIIVHPFQKRFPTAIVKLILANFQPYELAIYHNTHTPDSYCDAARNGNIEYLTEYKQDYTDFSMAFHDAAENEQIVAYVLLKKFGAKIAIYTFNNACIAGRLEVINLCDKLTTEELNHGLCLAAKANKVLVVVLLKTLGANDSSSALRIAAMHGYNDIIEALYKDITHYSTLICDAVSYNQMTTVKLLISYPEVNALSIIFALREAIESNYLDMVQLLAPLTPNMELTFTSISPATDRSIIDYFKSQIKNKIIDPELLEYLL